MGENEECTLEGVTVLKANRLGVVVSLAFSALLFVALVSVIALAGFPHGKDGGAFVRVMLMGMMGGGFGAWYFGRMSRRASDLAGELRATRNGIYVRGKRLIARREIKSAYVWPGRGDGAVVRIERSNVFGPVDLKVKDVNEGRALLHALGLDATQSASAYNVSGPSRGHWRKRLYLCWAGVALAFASFVSMGFLRRSGAPELAPLAGIFALLSYVLSIAQFFMPARITIGADGVHTRWLWQQRFVKIHDIAGAEVAQGELSMNVYPIYVRITLKSGETIDVLAQMGRAALGTNQWGFNRFVRMRAEIIAERINEAVEGAGKGTSSAWDATLLARGGRAMEDWVATLRGLRDRAETFREQGAVLEELWRVLEDAQATPEKRAAAAVALSPHLDDAGRDRLRVAAQATVAPKLRIALEAASLDDDDRLVHALDEVARA